jgi:TetR/AcrR family transcriptional repressor of nem operon
MYNYVPIITSLIMPKTELFDKEIAIEKAMHLFWSQGYRGTSLTDLTNLIGIGKGSFYNTFKSKRALFKQCINVYRTNSINELSEILRNEKKVDKGLQKFLNLNLEYAFNDPKHKGCFLTNTCTELCSTDDAITKSMNEHYKLMETIIIDYLSIESSLSVNKKKQIANTIITFFIGITVKVKLQKNRNQIAESIKLLTKSLF